MSGRIFDWQPADGRAAATSARGRRTRDAIVEAALTAFRSEGFVNTTMFDIAREAGVASGTAYQYFTDKNDVLRCILSTIEDRLYRETRMPADPQGRLIVVDSVVRALAVYREYDAAYGAWWELLVPPTEFTDAWVKTHDAFRADIAKVIRRGQREKAITRELGVDVAADLVVTMFERTAYSRIVLGWDGGVTDDDVAATISALLGDGLAGH